MTPDMVFSNTKPCDQRHGPRLQLLGLAAVAAAASAALVSLCVNGPRTTCQAINSTFSCFTRRNNWSFMLIASTLHPGCSPLLHGHPAMPALHPPRLALLLLAAALSCVSRTAAQQPPNDPVVMAALLAQRDAITNWEEFATANNITGWTADAPYCQWHKKTVQCIGQTGAINV